MSERARRRARPTRATVNRPAFIKRQVPAFEYLSEEGLTRIEDQADHIIQEIGLEFREDPKALEIWKDAGADVKGTRVRLPKGMARELSKTAPLSFQQCARNPENNVMIGDGNSVFAAVYGPPFVRDLEKGRRYGSMEDFEKLVKLAYMLPGIHHTGFVICEPCDIPVNKRHLDMLYTHMRWSDKPHLGAIVEKERAEDSVEMARIVHGSDFVDNNCVIMGNVNTNSPLLVDKVVTEAIYTYSGQGQGMIVSPFILSGAMGPVTTAASISLAFAEALVCCAFAQLVKPGSPFILGNFLSSMSLKTGAPTFGMPEPVASHYIIGQLARRAGLPLRCGGSLTAAKICDAQAAYESADSMHSTVLAGANFILHSAGWLEGGLATGFEKLIIDADRLRAYEKLLGGVELDANAIGAQAFDDVEPAGHFLGSAHTMANYEIAFYESVTANHDSCEQWEEDGSKTTEQRAFEKWQQMLKEYQAPDLDAAIDEELKAYIAKKKESMTDAWY